MKKRYTRPRRLMMYVSIFMLLSAFLTWTLGIAPVQAVAPQPPSFIRLHYATFDPLQAKPLVPMALSTRGTSERTTTYLVQFTGPVREAWKQKVETAGCQLYGYVPDFSFIAQMDGATAEEVAALSFVRWVGLYHPAYRLESSLHQAQPATRAHIMVQTLPDADLDALAEQVSTWGGEVKEQTRNDIAGYLRVVLETTFLEDLAALDGVLWVEPYFEPELANDIGGGTIMRTGEVRASLGLYGEGQIVAVADSGLDTGNANTIHPDLQGRIVKAYALGRTGDWSDPNGHGTHVAGSVLGNGNVAGSNPATHQYTNAYAGTAPEAQLVMQALGDSQGGLGGIPADTGALMRTAYADGARVHTNSWGGPTGGTQQNPEYGGYTASSQQVDQAMWEHKDMLTLFCAHNHGVDANKDGVVDPDTVTQPGTAKNVLTVGASENDRDGIASTWGTTYAEPIASDKKADNPDGMASFSSRGPLDDGRVKPDIVAPGTYIASLRTRQYVFDDDMEAGSTADDYALLTSNGGTGNSWQLATDDPHSPNQYWKASVNGTYNAGAMTILLAPVANVQLAGGAFDLSFWHKYNLSGDNQLVLLLTDNDLAPQFWIPLEYSGSQSSYQLFSMTIPTTLCDQQSQNCLDFTNFGVGFAIVSQSGSYNSEWWLDDIRGDGPDWGTMSSLGLAQPGDAVDEAYVMQGGTSMATPLTAGAAALVREWYNDEGVANPSSALMKATMLNGAADMSPGQYGTGATQEIPTQRPNNVTGWGRVDLMESLDPPAPRKIWYADNTTGLGTGRSVVYTLTIESSRTAHRRDSITPPKPQNTAKGTKEANVGAHALSHSSVFISSTAMHSFAEAVAAQILEVIQLLQNPGFESGDWIPWTIYTNGIIQPSLSTIDQHSGTWSAHMGNEAGGVLQDVDQVYQQDLLIPADNVTDITAEFWYRVRTDEVYTGYYDQFCYVIWNQDTTIAYDECLDLGALGDVGWTKVTWTMSADQRAYLAGKTVIFGFEVDNDASDLSRVWVDDIAFNVTTGNGTEPSLVVTPESGPRGTTFTITGSDFNANDTVTITLDGTSESTDTTDGNGSFTFDFTPPGTIAQGTHVITGTDSNGHSAGDTFEIVPQLSVTVTPSSGQPGDAFTVTGYGFHGGSTISVTLDSATDGTTTADTGGAFTYTLSTGASISGGMHTVGAVDDEGSTGSDTFTITAATARQVNITPASGPNSTTFTITGTNFTASALVTLTVDGAFIKTATATGSGDFNTTYTPTSLDAGAHTLRADDSAGHAETSFSITAPAARQVGVTPSSGPNGTTFTITGTNFIASASLTLTVDGAFIKTATANGSGAFNTTYTPASLSVGQHTLRADDGGGYAETTFSITQPSQTGGPFRFTLAWTDYPAELSAAKALVNDLDLEIIAPDGTHYYGNQGLYAVGHQCLRENKWDTCNNVEGAVIPNARYGTYVVIVHGHNVPQGPQPFALVASGDNLVEGGTPPTTRQVSISPSEGPLSTTFTINGSNFTASAGVTLTVDSTFVKRVTAGVDGAFSTTYTPTDLTAGQHTLVADDGQGQAQTTFRIVAGEALYRVYLPLLLRAGN